MCLVAAVMSKEQIQHVLKLVRAFPQALMSFGWNLQDWISSRLGGTCDKIVHVSLSRIHGRRSVPDTLKAIQRNHSLAESSHFPAIWATCGNFSFFIMMGSFSPLKKNKIKYKSKKKQNTDRCLFQCTWQVTKFRLLGTKWNERLCEREACQGPVFYREGIWTEITSCWSQLWQRGLRSEKDPGGWFTTNKLNFMGCPCKSPGAHILQSRRNMHVGLPFSVKKTQSKVWPSTWPNQVYEALNVWKEKSRTLRGEGVVWGYDLCL